MVVSSKPKIENFLQLSSHHISLHPNLSHYTITNYLTDTHKRQLVLDSQHGYEEYDVFLYHKKTYELIYRKTWKLLAFQYP